MVSQLQVQAQAQQRELPVQLQESEKLPQQDQQLLLRDVPGYPAETKKISQMHDLTSDFARTVIRYSTARSGLL